MTNAEIQRAFKARMYAAGYRQVQLWIRSGKKKPVKRIDIEAFIKRVRKLTDGMSEKKLSNIFVQLIEIIESKKEATRQRKG